jgi:hypothetical protein
MTQGRANRASRESSDEAAVHRLEDFAVLDLLDEPVWLIDVEHMEAVWANRAAADFWGFGRCGSWVGSPSTADWRMGRGGGGIGALAPGPRPRRGRRPRQDPLPRAYEP